MKKIILILINVCFLALAQKMHAQYDTTFSKQRGSDSSKTRINNLYPNNGTNNQNLGDSSNQKMPPNTQHSNGNNYSGQNDSNRVVKNKKQSQKNTSQHSNNKQSTTNPNKKSNSDTLQRRKAVK